MRRTGNAWAYPLAGGVIAWLLVGFLWSIWDDPEWGRPVAALTFGLVRVLLRFALGTIVVDEATLTIGSSRFSGTIDGACSGIEGMGLMLMFSAAWVWFFRQARACLGAAVLSPRHP